MSMEDVAVETRCVVLHWAHKNSRVDVIGKIVEQGTEVKDRLGRTLLHYAADHGNCDVVDVLLSKNADVDASDKFGRTAFDFAMMNGHMSTAGRLVLASKRVEDLTVETSSLVFHWACKNKKVDVARNIVEHHGTEWKDDYGRVALDIVAVYDNVDIADIILKGRLPDGNDVETTVCMSMEDVAVETRCVVLHWAHKNSRVDVIRKIVEQGTEVKDNLGRTLLHYAADHGNCDVVDVLLSKNADVYASDKFGRTAFDFAMMNGHMSTAGRLVLASKRVEDLTVETSSLVFHWACKNKKVDVARDIVECHGTEWKDDDGHDALDIVAVYDNVDIADIILKRRLPDGNDVETTVSMSMEDVAVKTRCVVLHWAHKNSRVDVIRKIVEQGTEVKDNLRRTLLHYAADHGNCDVVDVLLSKNADVYASDKFGRTAFDFAMMNGHMSTAGRLVLASKRVEDLTVETSSLVFHWACKNKKVDVARDIVECHGTEWKDDDGHDALDIVAVYDNVDIADIILKRRLPDGNDVETTVSMSMEDVAVKTRCVVLHWAHKNSRVDVIRKIVEQGTEVKDRLRRTLLHYAADHGNCDVVDVLLSKNADVYASDKDGKRPFDFAVRRGHMSTANRLLSVMQSVEDVALENVWKLLQWAYSNEVDVATKIAEKFCQSVEKKSGRTLLHFAAQVDHREAVECLLEKKADADAKDKDGKRPFDFAVRRGHMLIANRLLSIMQSVEDVALENVCKLLQWACSNKVNVATKIAEKFCHSAEESGHTLLHFAAQADHREAIECLLEKKADADAKDKDGKRPFDFAVRRGHMSTANRLLSIMQSVEDVALENVCKLLQWAYSNEVDVATKIAEKFCQSVEKKSGRTLLHFAAELDHREAVKCLLEKKADADAKDKYGKRPFDFAVRRGHMLTANRLLSIMQSVEDVALENVCKLLQWACNNEVDVATKIAEKFCQSMEKKSGRTLLHFAALLNHCEAVECLLEKKADADVKDKDGKRPFDFALRRGYMSTANRLLSVMQSVKDVALEDVYELLHRPSSNEVDVATKIAEKFCQSVEKKSGCTLLHFAALLDHREAVERLLEKKADADAKDKYGKRPFDFALRRGYMSTANRLLSVMQSVEDVALEDVCELLQWACNNEVDVATKIAEKFCQSVEKKTMR
ncbi:serine/threonine-protein phosphatase 6 regulatory ankyrin repeat subunit B-like [Corticium candelabrum]|uniref:serine/threonine-protein phosphatase 6 regulatory ankyrin repeat subunit B-like n=1 Tax=Corticium candelabrum TaxID=121492 RepID=UPI002E264241|nr:serine/threonine-protein phosphatase 6 regulatory ankyrin repeat subunit B-like [Corticium candelabrum]